MYPTKSSSTSVERYGAISVLPVISGRLFKFPYYAIVDFATV